MKRIATVLMVLSCSLFVLEAAVKTVSNNPTSPGLYNSIQLAITNSSVGDTIYVHGSATSYGNITVNKRLTLIGSGYDVSGTDFNVSTTIGSLTFDSVAPTVISGCNVIGFYITGSITYASGDLGAIQNVTFERCNMNYYGYVYVSGNNWIIRNCILQSDVNVGNFKNVFIENNFLLSCTINNSNDASVYCNNNLFCNETYYGAFSSVTNINVRNNIFWNNNVSGCSSCNFLNNITNDDQSQVLPGASNTGSGNILNTDPKFTSALPALTITIPVEDLKTYDWHLQAASPGHNTGTDATDIGVYGGSSPWPGFTGMSKLPLVQNFLIKNPVVQKDGSINISVKAHKQQ